MSKVVNIGIVGAGCIGRIHIKNISSQIKNVNLVGVADVDAGRAQEVAEKYDNVQWYDSYEQMFEDDNIEAVLISATANTHKDIIVSAANRRKHIFCEKPIAITLEDADISLAAVEKTGVLMQIGFMRRFDHTISSAKREIDKGTIGKPLVFKAISRNPNERPDLEDIQVNGGLITGSAVHDIDLARWFMGSEVVRVYAEGGVLAYPEYKGTGEVDVALTTLTFQNGTIGHIEACFWSSYGYDTRLEIMGSEGALQVGYLQHDHYFLLNKLGVRHNVVPSWEERFQQAFVTEMQHFVNCIVRNETPLVTGFDGKKALEIALATMRSYQKGVPITIGF